MCMQVVCVHPSVVCSQHQMKREAVDLYQSHSQAQPSYCMPSATAQGGGAEGRDHAQDEGVIQSLHRAFYITTYGREMSRTSCELLSC